MYWMMQPLFFSHREWKGETTISYAASHHEFGLFSRERDRQFFSFKLWIERETTKKLSTVYIDCIVTLMYEYVKVILFSCDTGCLTSSCWERERDVISFSGTDREFSDERYWCQFCQFCQFFPCSSCWKREREDDSSSRLSCFRSILFVCHPYLLVVFTATKGDWMQTHLLSVEKKSHSLPELL